MKNNKLKTTRKNPALFYLKYMKAIIVNKMFD